MATIVIVAGERWAEECFSCGVAVSCCLPCIPLSSGPELFTFPSTLPHLGPTHLVMHDGFFFSAIEHRSLKLAIPSDLEIVVDVNPSAVTGYKEVTRSKQ